MVASSPQMRHLKERERASRNDPAFDHALEGTWNPLFPFDSLEAISCWAHVQGQLWWGYSLKVFEMKV